MGGAVAIKTAIELGDNVGALIVLDVVEGTAMASLPKMMSILQSKPSTFDSLQDAVDWR